MSRTHVERDALAALRRQLVSAAGRQSAKRRATRRKVIVVAVSVLLLAATAATAALTHFSTGVPAVDELLDIDVPESRHPAPPGSASEALSVKMGDGTYQTVAYLARDGSVCIASAERHRGSVRGSYGGCPPLESVNRRVQRHGGSWHASSHGPDERTHQLLVDGDVQTVRPLGEGDWKVLMTPPWTPEAPGARPLRLVVVIDDADIGNPDDGFQMGELPPEAYSQPTLELTYDDGRRRVLNGRQAK